MCDILTAVMLRCDKLPDIPTQLWYLKWHYTGWDILLGRKIKWYFDSCYLWMCIIGKLLVDMCDILTVIITSVYTTEATCEQVWYFNSCYLHVYKEAATIHMCDI